MLHLVKGLDVEETVFATGVLVALLATTRCFPAAADALTRRGLATMLLAVPISGVLLGTTYLALRLHQLVGHPPWHCLVVEAAAGLVGVDGPVAYRSTVVADRAAVLLGVLGLACLLTLLVMLLRPGRAPTQPHQRKRAGRVHGGRCGGRRSRARRPAHLAELRGVPRRVRPG